MLGGLFGDGKAQKAKDKGASVPAGVIHRLLTIRSDAFHARTGERPVVYKQDGPLLARLVKAYGADKVESRLKAFLAWDDPYIADGGYSIDLFYRQWNRLAVREAQQAPTSTDDGAARTRAHLDRLKGQYGR